MKNRRDKIIKTAEKLFQEQFSKSSEKTVQFCETHSSEVVYKFLEAFRKMLEQTRVYQEQMEKGKIRYLLFSYLSSSIFLEKYEIRIEMMDERFYNDASQAVAYWDAGAVYSLFETDVAEIKQKVEGQIYRLYEYEVDFIRYLYFPYYHRLAKAFIQSMLEIILQEEYLLPETICLESSLKIAFGEYMGKADILFNLKTREAAD